MSAASAGKGESLVLGGGCFWCTDAAYRLLPGVTGVTCGYAAGKNPNPTYEQICTGRTGHAEVIRIDYDPAVVTLRAVLDYFWHVHDPTQVGGQGNDHGTQYRSIILYGDAAQKSAAAESLAAAQRGLAELITTEIAPLTDFWPAEDYHQEYFAKHPDQGYCSVVIRPKIAKLRRELTKPSA